MWDNLCATSDFDRRVIRVEFSWTIDFGVSVRCGSVELQGRIME